jgi:hypothetical protein
VNAVDYSLLGDTYLAVPLEQLRALLLFGVILVLTANASGTDQIGAAAKGQRRHGPAVHS